MDLTLSLSPASALEWELFIKPSHSGVHLSFLSCLPMATKRSVARNQFVRALRYSSTAQGKERSIRKISQLLHTNDYPESEIHKALNDAEHVVAPRRKSASGTGNHPRRKWKTERTKVLKLPFINDKLAAQVSRRVRKFSSDVRIVYQSGPSLKRKLVESALCPSQCPREIQKSKEEKVQ